MLTNILLLLLLSVFFSSHIKHETVPRYEVWERRNYSKRAGDGISGNNRAAKNLHWNEKNFSSSLPYFKVNYLLILINCVIYSKRVRRVAVQNTLFFLILILLLLLLFLFNRNKQDLFSLHFLLSFSNVYKHYTSTHTLFIVRLIRISLFISHFFV